MWDKFIKQGGRCGLSNLPLEFYKGDVNKNLQTASLDRIDSKGDYNISNIRWIHKTLNRIKWDYTDDYFKYICKEITNYNNAVIFN